MKTRIFTFYFIIGIILSSAGQTTSINQYNSDHKKQGKWIVYWDDNWKEVNDSSKASFYRYTFFDNGENIYPMGPCGKKGWKLETTNKSESKPALVDGEYKWKDKNGKLSSIHVFLKGEYQECKEYFSDGKLSQHFAYTKKFRDQPNTYCIYHYNKKGELKFYIMHKSRGAWLLEEGSEDSMKTPVKNN